MRLTGNFEKKISKKIRKFFSQFLVYWELLLSPVVEKVVFESFWALDMAPTWAVPGLFKVMFTFIHHFPEWLPLRQNIFLDIESSELGSTEKRAYRLLRFWLPYNT